LIQDPEFVQKFEDIFEQKMREISSKLGLELEGTSQFLIGKDCKREDIWRNAIQENYKGHRKRDPDAPAFFKKVFEENLFQKTEKTSIILYHPHLEADDCIALSVKQIQTQYPLQKINIITSDRDYLQLVTEKVSIFDLSFKNISESVVVERDLFCKIVMGDKSDNIPSVLNKCGPKTALRCFQDKNYFHERMEEEHAQKKWEKNQLLIDFQFIPIHLQNEFYSSHPFLYTL
jgi:5'-3' exonuclease